MPQIQYSEKYFDDTYEYRHVVLPPDVARVLPKNRLLSELNPPIGDVPIQTQTKQSLKAFYIGAILSEWRGIGVQQSRGWVHYAVHRPEPHIMLFRRPLNYQQNQQQGGQQQPTSGIQSQPMGLQA
eukprot:Gb_39695 [translate_table: standard]